MASIYLDNAASTRPASEVLEAMAEVAAEHFANASSAHAAGAAAARELERARAELAEALGAEPNEIVFTSGGTEANALAILGAAARARGRHVVVTAIEHPAVLANVDRLAKSSAFAVSTIGVTETGIVDAAEVVSAMRPDTALVATMLVNNELGTIQPVEAIARGLSEAAAAARARRPHFHVDAVQAFGLLPVRPSLLGADSVAISGHKIHGPKGIGALWLRPGSRVGSVWEGGGQERGVRSGTENLPAIVGLARAASLAAAARKSGASARIGGLRDDLEARIRHLIPAAVATTSGTLRAPHICSLSIKGLPAEPLLHALEARGVFVSAGSACASKTRGPSHVLRAVGVDDNTAVLRFSLSRETTAADVEAAAQAFVAAHHEIAGGAGIHGAAVPNRI